MVVSYTALLREKALSLRRLEAQRSALNKKVRELREELVLLLEPGSYVGEVVKVMGTGKVLVKVGTEGKYSPVQGGRCTRWVRVRTALFGVGWHRRAPRHVQPT